MCKLKVENLTKVYRSKQGEVLALDDISLTVDESEFVAIVGPSGCGKSTLINIIGGLDEKTSGTVLVDGKEVSQPGADRGMVFQGYSLFPWLDVEKNVEFGLKMKGVPKEERREIAGKYINMVGLEAFTHAMPDQLSGGMKQRAAIARTLANSPSVLLMDEPFGALDAQTRVVMQESLVEIQQKTGSTVLFITHDIDEAILLSDRILVMSKLPGKIRNEIKVELSCQRNHSALTDPEFLEIKKQIMDILWGEMNLIKEKMVASNRL